MKCFAIKRESTPYFTAGWGNGYVIIPEGHICHGKDYDYIEHYYNIYVHGGLTFSEWAKDLRQEKWLPDSVETMETDWIIGFDTAHYGDSLDRWPDENSVLAECQRLIEQLNKLKPID